MWHELYWIFLVGGENLELINLKFKGGKGEKTG